MKKRPILFSAAMVRAILSGTKTQTRRVVKPQPEEIIHRDIGGGCTETIWCDSKRTLSVGGGGDTMAHAVRKLCHYGAPGDRLWVRETWAEICHAGDAECHCYDPETETLWRDNHKIEYRADTGNSRPGNWPEPTDDEFQDAPRWRPSIHMPRWASRITLEITNVRVQRVQEISEEDAKCEGVVPFDRIGEEQQLSSCDGRTQGSHPHTIAFASLWDSIYIERGFGWQLNPWVWVIDFKRVQ